MRYIKYSFLFITLWATVQTAFTQSPPGIEWQRTIGGTGSDNARKVIQTSDGGYLIGGDSGSNVFADKTEPNIGGSDYWLVKLNSAGETLWDKTIGGTSTEYLRCMVATHDGGYLLGGWSSSGIGGHKTEVSRGGFDYWIVKTDANGIVLWDKTIGGNLDDMIWAMDITPDGGFILTGWSYSDASGEKSEPSMGGADVWIVRLDSTGNILWDKTIGGDVLDAFYDIVALDDVNFIGGGESASNSSAYKSEDNILRSDGLRSDDFWVVDFNAPGDVNWDKTIGGTYHEQINSIIPDIENNAIVLAGYSSSSPSAYKTTPHYGNDDYWVVKWNYTDSVIEWQVGFGGDQEDDLRKIIRTFENNYLLCGFSRSNITGNKTTPLYGYEDYWLIKTDNIGNEIWQLTLGGDLTDQLYDCIQTSDGGYLVIGYSGSGISGVKTDPGYAGGDYWIIKLYPDEACPLQTWYADGDGDGYGNAADTLTACSVPPGYVANNLDCDDTNALINPGMTELCNGIDDNCSGAADDGIPYYTYFLDADEDGYGDATNSVTLCDTILPIGYVMDNTDCDDTNALINPAMSELCNGVDDNCNGVADDGIPYYTYYLDADGDGYGDAASSLYVCEATAPEYYVISSLDCDDSNADINPAASEICNDLDDNCNGIVDEGLPYFTYYADADGDGYGNPGAPLLVCFTTPPAGYVTDNTDCDDTNAGIYPGADEVFNGTDDNCNGEIDEGLVGLMSYNQDAFTLYPNPNTGSFSITGDFSSEIVIIEIYTFTGQLVYSNTFSHASVIDISLSNAFTGLAVVTLKTAAGIWQGVVEVL
jgi:hypothetical protein